MKTLTPKISVVIPACNAETTVGDTVRAVMNQPLPPGTFECIVVVDTFTDRTAEVAEAAGATVLRLSKNLGIGGARNAGVQQARGTWVAFTDADCVPSRRWLSSILAEAEKADESIFAFAGKTLGLDSKTPAARFMDLIGALDAEIYLGHKAMPWTPGGNMALRRDKFLEIEGFDIRLKTYETADLSFRLANRFRGTIVYVPSAVVLHRHRATWCGLWKQQYNYGVGYAQFILKHAEYWPWSLANEFRAWQRIAFLAMQSIVTHGDTGLARRGFFVKLLAQRLGFISQYFLQIGRRQF